MSIYRSKGCEMNTEENEAKEIVVSFKTKSAKIKIGVDSFEELGEKQEELYKIADFLFKIDSIFGLRDKFSQIYSIIPKELIIHYNENAWAIWERVLLILFNNHSFETARSEIWNYNISQSSLRGIIRDRTDYIETIEGEKIALTTEGLNYILEKLNLELKNYQIERQGEELNE